MISQASLSKLRRLMELRAARDELVIAQKESERAYRDAETEVYEELSDAAVVGTVKVNLGEPWGVVSFLPRETYFGKIIDPQKALEHYNDRAMLEEMTEPKFAMKRINEEVRECLEQGSTIPDGLDYYARRGVTITRQKG